ncbi:MAG: MerR family DNA-binding transcriptional regulator [Pseudomonadota bacterium]
MSEDLISFKDMCARFDVTPRTLRYYEYIELLHPKRDGRSRLYGPREVARMTLIMRGRRWGFSLEELRQWLLIYDHEGDEAQLKAWVPLAKEKMAGLRQQKLEIDQTIEELDKMMQSVQDDLDQRSTG